MYIRGLAHRVRGVFLGTIVLGALVVPVLTSGPLGSTPVAAASTCAAIPPPTTTTTPATTTTTLGPTSTTAPTTTTTTLGPTSTTAPTTTTTTLGPTSTTAPTAPISTAPISSAYYLISQNGAVHNYGGAGFFGSAVHKKFATPFTAGAATPDGGGYWLITARGNLENFGDAVDYGSPIHIHLTAAVIGLTPTLDGRGYWLTTANGSVRNYGDAPFCGSAIHKKTNIVGLAPTPDNGGYWLVSSTGTVYNYGDATPMNSIRVGKKHPLVSVSSSPTGDGFWAVSSNGGVYNFGTAIFYGSEVHHKLPKSIVSIAATPDGQGYWLAGLTGRIYNLGDAKFYGSMAHIKVKGGEDVVAIVPTVVAPAGSVVALPHNLWGYDISNYQCTKSGAKTIMKSLPTSAPISIVEAAGWLDSANNSCLSAEAAWAKKAAGVEGAAYNMYLFINSPGNTAAAHTQSATGPKGTCANLAVSAQNACYAYNYGYNGAKAAFTYATDSNATSNLWWVDVEGSHLSTSQYSDFAAGEYWSSNKTLNAATIAGAIDGLRSESVTVGIYSTSVQFPEIAGSYVPTGGGRIPLWVAGVPWTKPPFTEAGLQSPSVLAAWCAGTAKYIGTNSTDIFAGGVPWILQETPGTETAPYNLDPDYTC